MVLKHHNFLMQYKNYTSTIRRHDGKNQLLILVMILSILGNLKVEVITPNLQIRVATQQNLMHKALRYLAEFMQ